MRVREVIFFFSLLSCARTHIHTAAIIVIHLSYVQQAQTILSHESIGRWKGSSIRHYVAKGIINILYIKAVHMSFTLLLLLKSVTFFSRFISFVFLVDFKHKRYIFVGCNSRSRAFSTVNEFKDGRCINASQLHFNTKCEQSNARYSSEYTQINREK